MLWAMTNALEPEGSDWAATSAWHELLDGLRDLDASFLRGPREVRSEQSVAEGYRFLATMVGIGFDLYLFADSARPRFIDVNTPSRPDRRWGGDNTDAYYAFAPIDPERTYRIRGQRGDSVYFSLTIYNEPAPGQWSDRVVGIVNDSDLSFDDEGRFSFMVGPSRPVDYDGPFVELSADAASALTRDYQVNPATGQRVEWTIEATDSPSSYRHTDAATAASLRNTLLWIREMFTIVPLTVTPPSDRTTVGHNAPSGLNTFSEPYQVGDANYGWSARDACYSFGNYFLEPDQALVITHAPPDSRFWNLTVWNPFMATHNTDYATTSVNMGSAVPNADGTVTIVVAQQSVDHPNAVSTIGHELGTLAFRWFHADHVPVTPVAVVVAVDDAPRTVD
jgi:hypothetical protein